MNNKWTWIVWGLISVLIILSLTSVTEEPQAPIKAEVSDNDSIKDTVIVDTVDYYEQAIEHLKHYEGFRSQIYIDVDGSRTIGYGHHLLAGESYNNINEETATEILKRDFNSRLGIVEAKYDVKGTKALALTLFSFNLGLGGLDRAVNNGMLQNIQKIKQYCHYSTYSNGVRYVHTSSKLLERRNYELSLFLINK
jgi:GH24 family phage-related lysozyme (muramidase)